MTDRSLEGFVRDNAAVLAGHFLVYAKAILLMPLVIQTAGAGVFGAFALVTSFVGIAFALSSFGVGFRMQRFLPGAATASARAGLFYPQYLFSVGSLLLLAAACVAANGLLGRRLPDSAYALSPWAIPGYLLAYAHFSQAIGYYRHSGRVRQMVVANVLFAYLHVALLLVYARFVGVLSVNVLLLTQALSAVIVGGPMFARVLHELRARPVWYAPGQLIEDVRTGAPLVAGTIVDFLLAAGDRFILALFLGVTAVGQYTAGYTLGAVIVFVAKSIGTVLPQAMARAVDAGRPDDADRVLGHAVRAFVLLGVPFVFGSAILGGTTLRLLTSDDVAASAAWVVPVVAAGSVLYGLVIIQSTSLFVQQQTGAMFRVYGIAAAANVAANLVLLAVIPNILIAAGTTLLAYGIGYVCLLRALPHGQRFIIGTGAATRTLAAAALMSVLLVVARAAWLSQPSWPALAAQIALGVAGYAAALYVVGGISAREIAFVRGLMWRPAASAS